MDAVRETAIAIVVVAVAVVSFAVLAAAGDGVMSVAFVIVVVVVGGGGCSCCCGIGINVGGKQWQPVASCAASLQISHLKPLVRVIDEDPILGNFTALRHWYRRY